MVLVAQLVRPTLFLGSRLQVRLLPGTFMINGERSVVVSTRVCGTLRGSSNLLAHPSKKNRQECGFLIRIVAKKVRSLLNFRR